MVLTNICTKTSTGDNCIAVNGKVAVVCNILTDGDNKYIVFDEFLNQQSFLITRYVQPI